MLLELGHHSATALVRELVNGPRRYNELLAALTSLTEPALSAALHQLDADGLVRRRVDPGPPLRVLYELTPFGHDLVPALEAIALWTLRSDAQSTSPSTLQRENGSQGLPPST